MTTPHHESRKTGASIENNPCAICRAMGLPICKGHGGGGSGGGGSSEAKSKDATYTSTRTSNTLGEVAASASKQFDQVKTIWVQVLLTSDRTINYEAGLFSIEGDRMRGNLTLRVKPGLSKEEIEIAQEFLKAVKKEFDDYKNQLIEQGVPTKATANLKDNELTIHVPNPILLLLIQVYLGRMLEKALSYQRVLDLIYQ